MTKTVQRKKLVDIVGKYSERAKKLKPKDKSIAVENVLISYSLKPEDRLNNGYNLHRDAQLYSWTAQTVYLMERGLHELYTLYDKGLLDYE
jgi:hypothetical protein